MACSTNFFKQLRSRWSNIYNACQYCKHSQIKSIWNSTLIHNKTNKMLRNNIAIKSRLTFGINSQCRIEPTMEAFFKAGDPGCRLDISNHKNLLVASSIAKKSMYVV